MAVLLSILQAPAEVYVNPNLQYPCVVMSATVDEESKMDGVTMLMAVSVFVLQEPTDIFVNPNIYFVAFIYGGSNPLWYSSRPSSCFFCPGCG